MQFNFYIALLIIAFLISLAIAIYTWLNRKEPLQTELFFLILAIAVWCFAAILEAVFTDLDLKIIFCKISYIGIVTAPVFFLFFISRYTNTDDWITTRTKVLMLVIPAVNLLMAATNELHKLVWSDIFIKQNDIAGVYGFFEHGLWYWVHIVYSYSFLIIGIVILLFSIIRYKRFYSLQSRGLIIASFAPFIGSIVYSFNQSGLEGIDITPICFSITGICLTLAIFRYRLFDITPIAREIVTENIYDGVLLLNKDRLIIDINQAACRLLSVENDIIGKSTIQVFSGNEEMLGFLKTINKDKRALKEICIDNESLFLELRVNSLQDNRNRNIGNLIIIRDITASKIAEQKLEEYQNLLLNIINFLPDATFVLDREGKVIAWNKAMEKISGVNKEDIIGKGNYEHSVPLYGERRPMLADYLIGEPGNIKKHYNLLKKEGNNLVAELKVERNREETHFWLAASPLLGSNNEVVGAIESIRNITDIKNTEKELRHISFHDSLTGLYNRAYFEEEILRLNKTRMLPLSIIIADLNGLKLVNDAFGHDMGDKLLKKAAGIIKKSCRSEDIIARWGGDEFSIVLHSSGEKQTKEIITRIQSACGRARFKIPVSISLGYAIKTNPRTRIETVLKKAEDSMYRNKLISSKRVKNEIVDFLTRTLFERNIDTEVSSEKVVRLAKRMGERFGLPENKMKELVLHARLHDIGKVAVKEKILMKKGELDQEEWEEVKKHTEIGYRIANASTLLSPIAEYILCQHEWWDGSGYPRNLKGTEIPMISRIVALADSFEAMISDRPYRKALSWEEAIGELNRSSGTQFDPELVKVFISILGEENR